VYSRIAAISKVIKMCTYCGKRHSSIAHISNDDYTVGGSDYLQSQLRGLIEEYSDIFSYLVKGLSMDVLPIEFTVNASGWESNTTRAGLHGKTDGTQRTHR